MKTIKLILTGLLVLALASCSEDAPVVTDTEDEPETPQEVVFELTEAEGRAAVGVADFGINLFENYNAAARPGENVVLSPLSASIFLSMLANGAGNELTDEITDALGTTDLENLNTLNHKLLTQLPQADASVDLNFANGFWYRNSLTLRPEFRNTLTANFVAETSAMNFADEAGTVESINNWVSAKTSGKINSIIGSLPAECHAIMANAMVFAASWAEPFEEKDTKNEIFYGLTADRSVPMMHLEKKQHYASGDNFLAVKREMGYGSLEAIFILPKEGVDIDDFILSGGLRDVRALRGWWDEVIKFSMPRFEIQAGEAMALNKSLRTMGLEHIDNLQNQQIFNENVTVRNNIFQKNSLRFTEAGAEGASVTYGFMCGAAFGSEPEIPEVHLNRPFIFAIYAPAANTYLYIGKIVNL